jgi:hypothetical protein
MRLPARFFRGLSSGAGRGLGGCGGGGSCSGTRSAVIATARCCTRLLASNESLHSMGRSVANMGREHRKYTLAEVVPPYRVLWVGTVSGTLGRHCIGYSPQRHSRRSEHVLKPARQTEPAASRAGARSPRGTAGRSRPTRPRGTHRRVRRASPCPSTAGSPVSEEYKRCSEDCQHCPLRSCAQQTDP